MFWMRCANLTYLLRPPYREEPESLAQKNVGGVYLGPCVPFMFCSLLVICLMQAKASVQDLLQFRQAVAFMNDSHPFSRAFGLVSGEQILPMYSYFSILTLTEYCTGQHPRSYY